MAASTVKDYDALSLGPNEVDEPETPEWLKAPATVKPLESMQDFIDRANIYFQHCDEDSVRPTITGLALAVGLPGPTSLIRLGQRIPELRYAISRCMTAIAYSYEQMIGQTNAAGPKFMLMNIPDFDPEEADGAPGVQFFNERKEILLEAHVPGAAVGGEDFDEEQDPLAVYLSVIKRPGGVTHTKRITPQKTTGLPRLFTIISETER